MPGLLAVGHVTRDRLSSGEALGGAAAYAALTAAGLGWQSQPPVHQFPHQLLERFN